MTCADAMKHAWLAPELAQRGHVPEHRAQDTAAPQRTASCRLSLAHSPQHCTAALFAVNSLLRLAAPHTRDASSSARASRCALIEAGAGPSSRATLGFAVPISSAHVPAAKRARDASSLAGLSQCKRARTEAGADPGNRVLASTTVATLELDFHPARPVPLVVWHRSILPSGEVPGLILE